MSALPSHPTRRGVAGLLAIAGAYAAAAAPATASPKTGHGAALALPPTPAGSAGDFDFEHGRWRTTLRRRLHPLSGSDVWADYAGTTTVLALWGGRANIVELNVCGPEGRLEGLSLRLFEPRRKRWTLNFSNAGAGTLVPPMTGGFGGGRSGLFYSAETFESRPVLVRFMIESTSADTCRFEQAFSIDSGSTWETNWIALDMRS
jgi:hypothetical protein